MDAKLQILQWALQALAQPAEVQLTLFPDFVCKTDELALDFDNALGATSDLLNSEQRECLRPIDKVLDEFSGEANASYWSEDALRNNSLWSYVRNMARHALELFGWPNVPPPKDPNERGTTYVKR